MKRKLDGDDFKLQPLRRAHVTCSMALIDAIVHYTKQMSYNFAVQMIRPVQQQLGSNLHLCPVIAITQRVSDGELAMLIDEQVQVKNNGDVDVTKSFLDFKRNFKFAFKSAVKIFDAPISLDFSNDPGWSSLNKAIEIRNRLMHPKPSESMNVSDQDIDFVRKAYCWVISKEAELTEAISSSALKIGF